MIGDKNGSVAENCSVTPSIKPVRCIGVALVPANGIAGSILGSVGSFAGVAIAPSVAGVSAGEFLGDLIGEALLPGIGIFIGALFGDVLGTVVGNPFGSDKKPEASASLGALGGDIGLVGVSAAVGGDPGMCHCVEVTTKLDGGGGVASAGTR